MKILLLSDLNSIHTKKWVTGLAKRNCEICVFGLSKPQDDFYESLDNVTIAFAELEGLRSRSILSKLIYLKQRKKIKEVYKAFKPDIVHAHYATSYGMLGSLLKHKPYLISVWGSDVFEFPQASFINKIILKRNLSKATRLFSTSKIMGLETKKYTNKKVETVPFGVDITKFHPVPQKKESTIITLGIIKTLELNYGINYLLDAFKLIISKYDTIKFKLTIAGDGSQKEALKKQVHELNIEDLVDFKGQINQTEVADCFNQMDIAIIASLAESFGVSAVEAAACGIPVVATNVGGLPEVVLDGKTGLLCPSKNPQALANQISKLIEDSDLRKKMGKEARKFVVKNYNWEKNVDLMMTHYQSIMEKK